MRDFGVFRWEIVICKGTEKFIRYVYSNRRRYVEQGEHV